MTVVAPHPASSPAQDRVRRRVRVAGVVQGVGFRPFVHQAATALGLAGSVANDPEGVLIDVTGDSAAVTELVRRVREEPPAMALVLDVVVEELDVTELDVTELDVTELDVTERDVTGLGADGGAAFVIAPSVGGARPRTFVSPDIALCAACRRELADPANRRYRHPFVTCTDCGPRLSLTTAVPYDRGTTTMAGFGMCPACAAEYADPADRRFHAQPICCPDCGPTLELVGGARPLRGDEALAAARAALRDGLVVAVKGVGGYHLVCDAADEDAVARLRRRKARGGKPFAIMVADLAAAAVVADLGDDGADGDGADGDGADEADGTGDGAQARVVRDLLTGPQHPIVLLPRRTSPQARRHVAPSVAPGSPDLGVMLPYTPLHVLLLGLPEDPAGPLALVMTSGNRSGEPIACDDEEALDRLAGLADLWLRHDRPIAAPCDDSVARVVDGRPLVLRRSRGYAPLPVTLPVNLAGPLADSLADPLADPLAHRVSDSTAAPVPPILAAGADLKSVACLAEGRFAWLTEHIGDMDDADTLAGLDGSVDRLARLTGVRPEALAADAHPGYRSTAWARARAQERPLVLVQHHHAHIAAVMAEHGLDGRTPVLGVAFDGTGYGCREDSRAESWGGEVLVADYDGYRRIAHLATVPQPGGDVSVQRPYRMALTHLDAADLPWSEDLPPVAACPPRERAVLRHQLDTGLGCVPTSSMGRLFDAVASLLGVCQEVGYEAQAAIELEGLARACAPTEAARLPRFGLGATAAADAATSSVLDPGPVLAGLVGGLAVGTPPAALAAGFHRAVADVVVAVCRRERQASGLDVVALGGGVWQNALLLGLTRRLLRDAGFTVLVPAAVPPNDGGLALGQVVVAAAALARHAHTPSTSTPSTPSTPSASTPSTGRGRQEGEPPCA